MKKVVCLLLLLSLCLTAAGCGAPSASTQAQTAADMPVTAPVGTFPPEFLTVQSLPTVNEEAISECPDLAVTGKTVWRITHGSLLCEDPAAGNTLASRQISELLDWQSVDFRALAAWSGDSVLACFAGDGGAQAELIELGLDGAAVKEGRRYDAAEKLGFLFKKDAWLEVDMTSCGQSLFFAALDPDFALNFFLYTPETGALLELGKQELGEYNAAFSTGEKIILALPDEIEDTILHLVRLSSTDGSREELCSITMDSAHEAANLAYDASAGCLYYTVNSALYAVTPAKDEPPRIVGGLGAVASSFRLGALVNGRYVCHGLEGQLLSCALDGAYSVVQLRIADTQWADTLADAARDYGVVNPARVVSVLPSAEENELLEELRQSPDAYDAYVVQLDSAACRALFAEGFTADLSGNEVLAAVRDHMPARMRAALEDGGELKAFPLAVYNTTQTLNLAALKDLIGMEADQAPTDWKGFLQLLQKLAKKNALADQKEYVLYSDITVGEYRDMVLEKILQSCQLWVRSGEGSASQLKKLLPPILKEYEKVDWIHLGLPLESLDDMGFSMNTDVAVGGKDGVAKGSSSMSTGSFGIPVVADELLEIEVIDMEEGAQFWPLSLQSGGQRQILQNLAVICVNPNSPNREAAADFVEYIWRKMGTTAKMTLCASLNDPVVNEHYKEDLAFFEEEAASLEREALREKDPVKKEILNVQAKQTREFAARFRNNAAMAASEESIAYYRSVQDGMIPIGDGFWSNEASIEAEYDYLDGFISAAEMIERLEPLM